MTVTTRHSLRLSRTFRVDADTLFRAWTDPEGLRHWWRMEEKGWAFANASVDVRVGGRYRLGMTDPDGRLHVAAGEYREVERPRRLVFTWDWENPTDRVGETLVTVEFRAAGTNMTELVLTHERFADPRQIAGHERGWGQLLTLLDHFMKGEAV